jgi:hypothetical protein
MKIAPNKNKTIFNLQLRAMGVFLVRNLGGGCELRKARQISASLVNASLGGSCEAGCFGGAVLGE